MPRKAKVITVVANRTLKLREGVQVCAECGIDFKYSHYSAHKPTRCPPCKIVVRNAARRASYHRHKDDAGVGRKRGTRAAG